MILFLITTISLTGGFISQANEDPTLGRYSKDMIKYLERRYTMVLPADNLNSFYLKDIYSDKPQQEVKLGDTFGEYDIHLKGEFTVLCIETGGIVLGYEYVTFYTNNNIPEYDSGKIKLPWKNTSLNQST